MKLARLFVALVFFSWALPSAAAIAHVVSWTVATGQPGDPVAIDNGGAGVDTTGAQLIVVTVGANDSVTGITDNKGNTYQIAGARTANGDGTEIWYSITTSVGAGHTISVDMASSAFSTAAAAAYGGFTGTIALDQSGGATGTSSTLSSGNVTTTVADELIIGSGTHVSTGGAFTAGASYTIRAQYSNSGDNATGYLEDRIVSATGTYAADATVAGNSDWAARIATFNGSTGATREQEGFRWGVDDGNEASHTFEASQDTDISITDNQSRLLRTLVNATLDPASAAYTLRYQKNGAGGYAAVPVGSTTASSITNQNVAASADDGQDIGGTNTITGTTIGASLDATTEWAAMRFTNITIPAGATITSASVGVVPSASTEDEPLVTVFLEAADNCAAYTTGASNISGRSRGTGVSWSSADLGANGSTYFSTPDLTAAVQAVVSRVGWASGNALCVHIQGGATGTRDLTIEAQDLGPNTNPPRLSVAWTTPNEVYVTTSANIAASGEATTARLTAPGAKSTSDFVTGRRWDDENGTDSIDITTDDYTEVEWLVFVAASAADSDYFDFRTYAGSSALDTYTVTPRWTIPSAGGGVVVNPISGRGGAAASPIIN